MTARCVLTSVCVQAGTVALTAPLRQRLLRKERIRLVDEDGEVYEGQVDWEAGVVRGVGPYYAKRRLGANEAILLHFRGEEIELKALPRVPVRVPAPAIGRPQAQEKPRSQEAQEKPKEPQGKAEPQRLREKPEEFQERPTEEVKWIREKRVRAATATAPSSSPNEAPLPPESKGMPKALHPPGVTEHLERLGFFLEGGPLGSTRPSWDGGGWPWSFCARGRGNWVPSIPTASGEPTWPFWPRSRRRPRCPKTWALCLPKP